MMPLRASMSFPPTTTPLVRAGLSPSTFSLEIVTLFASTRITLLAAPPHSDPPSHTGFELAGSITVPLPEPLSVTGLSTTTFST